MHSFDTERFGGLEMSRILSYSAGSASRDPHGYREIDEQGSAEKLSRIMTRFPDLAKLLGDFQNVLLINAYPATLGGLGQLPLVDTYLHPPTFVRATTLAALEKRTVLCAAQPLMGAEMLLRASQQSDEFPEHLIWSTGGYPLPQSLERAVRSWLIHRGCDLTVLHCYGIAELDHTLMAAMHRDQEGRLIFHAVQPNLQIDISHQGCHVDSLGLNSRRMRCEDQIDLVGETYRIGGDARRFPFDKMARLETWTIDDWTQLTGHVGWTKRGEQLQRRAHCDSSTPPAKSTALKDTDFPSVLPLRHPTERNESSGAAQNARRIAFHTFAGRFGMSWQQKPNWTCTLNRPAGLLDQHVDAA